MDNILDLILKGIVPLGLGIGIIIERKAFLDKIKENSKEVGKGQEKFIKVCLWLIGLGGIAAGVKTILSKFI